MRRVYWISILLILAFNLNSIAQEYAEGPYDPRSSYGFFVGYGINTHTADFKKIKGTESCCEKFESGTGAGILGGIYYNMPLDTAFEIQFRIYYQDLSGKVTREQPDLMSTPEGGKIQGAYEYTADGKFTTFGLAPMLNYKVSDQFHLHGGFRIGLLQEATFEQFEKVISPDFGYYLDTKKRIRNEFSGDLPDASSIESAIMLGASFNLPMNESKTLFFVPEVFYQIGLTSFGADLGWSAQTLAGGIGLKYAPRAIIPVAPPPPPPPIPPMPLPLPPPEVPVLNAAISAVSVDENGIENDVTNITVEEFLQRKILPLLSYVFFDEGQSELPERYIRLASNETGDFNDKELYNLRTLEVYRTILNIVGERMDEFRQAELTLVGCNANMGAETGNIELSRSRAQSVKDYLVNVWNIDENRIKIEARDLPEKPSNRNEADGQQENRRVEMTSNFPQIFEPLIIRDTLTITNPPLLRFKPEVFAEIGIQSWKLTTAQSNGELKVFEGTGQPPTEIDWDLEAEREFIPRLDEDFLYKLEVVDNDNKVWESPMQKLPVKSLTVQNKFMALLDGAQVNDVQFDMYSLISFAYNSAELTTFHIPIIEQAIRQMNDVDEYKIDISGYTDRTGSAQLNLRLSQDRANNTADGLKVSRNFAKGYGKDNPLYNNDLPEGRFYNRTVYIELESTTTLDFEDME
jgi:outer membrane protein OmpA-like peptidoglycan-associated protein